MSLMRYDPVQVVDVGARQILLPRAYNDVLDRVAELREARDETFDAMLQTAEIMDGGHHAIRALQGQYRDQSLRNLPIANYMRDAAEAFASRLSAIPELRVDPPSTGRKSDDNESRLKHAEKRARIVASYDDDHNDGIASKIPMLARWVPGAGYAVFTIDPVQVGDYPYPRASLHSPLDTMVAQWTSIAPPEDVGFVRKVQMRELIRMFPEHAASFRNLENRQGTGGAVDLAQLRPGLGVEVVQYYDRYGCWWLLPHKRMLLDFVPNPLESGPSFVAMTKFNYNRLRGEYDDMVGPMVSMARLQILSELGVSKALKQPTNLFTGAGGPLSGNYKTGFNAVNVFDNNARVEIPNGTMQFQAWQQLDRLERTLRIEGQSPVQDSGESPMSFVTGRGLNALSERVDRTVREYQRIFKTGLQKLDSLRLEYDEKMWPDIAKPMEGVRAGSAFTEMYTPSKHIKGSYRTRREYGAMAAVDEATKLNGMMLMTQADPPWVSTSWVRTQLDDLGVPVTQIEDQIRAERADRALDQYIMAHATEPSSPEHLRALRLMLEDLPEGDRKRRASEFLASIEEAQAEQQRAMEQQQGQMEAPPSEDEVLAALGGMGQGGATPTTLARVTAAGQSQGGTQVIAG
jgi:hypothetical protein